MGQHEARQALHTFKYLTSPIPLSFVPVLTWDPGIGGEDGPLTLRERKR